MCLKTLVLKKKLFGLEVFFILLPEAFLYKICFFVIWRDHNQQNFACSLSREIGLYRILT